MRWLPSIYLTFRGFEKLDHEVSGFITADKMHRSFASLRMTGRRRGFHRDGPRRLKPDLCGGLMRHD